MLARPTLSAVSEKELPWFRALFMAVWIAIINLFVWMPPLTITWKRIAATGASIVFGWLVGYRWMVIPGGCIVRHKN